MGDFLKSVSSFLTFLQQHVFPSFIFVILNGFAILPALLRALSQWGIDIGFSRPDLLTTLGLAFIVAVVLGYVLENFNIPLIELFQGYHLRGRLCGKWLTKRQKGRREHLVRRVRNLENRSEEQIERLRELASRYEVGSPERERLYKRRRHLEQQFREEIVHSIEYYQKRIREEFPLSDEVMPTRLGNVIASSYDYARQRYAIDAVALWPRILPLLLQKGYDTIVVQEKARVDFFLDSCVLYVIFSVECLLIMLFGAELWFLGGAVLSLALACGLYRLAVIGALNWGRTIRAAFDLYRYDLLSDLHGQPPRDFEHEKALWRQLSEFIREGEVPEGEAMMSHTLDYQRIQKTVRKPPEAATKSARGEDK